MAMGDRRDYLRRGCSTEVQICWQDGVDKVASAECLDLSRTGARVKATVPVETFRKVRLTCEEPVFDHSGVVKYCVRQNGKFVIGVEFTDAATLIPPAPSPSRN